MKNSSELEKYIDKIITNVIPTSDLHTMPVNSSGLVHITPEISIKASNELPDSVKAGLYKNEKNSTYRYNILVSDKKINEFNQPLYHAYYFKPFSGTFKSLQSIMAQSVLELYPTPLGTYGAVLENSTISGCVVDLNHLMTKEGHEPIETLRLDMLLHKLGFDPEINSFLDLQKIIKSENIQDILSERAIVQLALCSYFIPNAIGETDANSRNVILLKDPKTNKFEYVTRIDAEKNIYFDNFYNNYSESFIIPKGIYGPDEEFTTKFLPNIKEKSSEIDWNLFIGFTAVANKMTDKTHVDDAIYRSFMKNYFKVPYENIRHGSTPDVYLNSDAYGYFSEYISNLSKYYHSKVYEALGNMFISELPFQNMTVAEPSKLEMQLFDQNGNPFSGDTPEDPEMQL